MKFRKSLENLKNLKYHTSKKKQFCLLFAVSEKFAVNADEKTFKEKNQLKYKKLLV